MPRIRRIPLTPAALSKRTHYRNLPPLRVPPAAGMICVPMDELIELPPDADAPFPAPSLYVQPLAAGVLRQQGVASHLVLLRDGTLAGRCSIWADATPVLEGKPVGVVGHYAAADAVAGAALLARAAGLLRERGLSRVVGPMDGNTWRRYRLLTRRGAEPPFFLEPDNPDDWPGHFAAAGFEPLATYFSGLNEDLSVTDPRVPAALERLRGDGIVLRTMNLGEYERELRKVHALSLAAFAGNFLYTPITEDEFIAMYAPVAGHLRPELVLMAEQRGTLVGFMFGLPDLMQARRGKDVDTAIAKTIAVQPGRTGAGLGSVLIDQFQQAARRLGYRRVIHALMHEGNRSRQMVARFGRPFREYTLFAKATGA